MGSKPKVKPYQPSAEEVALQKAQMEEINRKESELAEQKYRRQRGSKRRSLISHMGDDTKQTLGE